MQVSELYMDEPGLTGEQARRLTAGAMADAQVLRAVRDAQDVRERERQQLRELFLLEVVRSSTLTPPPKGTRYGSACNEPPPRLLRPPAAVRPVAGVLAPLVVAVLRQPGGAGAAVGQAGSGGGTTREERDG